MTTPQHITNTFLLTYTLTHSIMISVISGVIASLPDVIGWIARLRKPGDWSIYNWAHHTWWLMWIPPYGLHCLIDRFWHKPDGGWYSWGIYGEIAAWVVCIAWVFFLYY